jgi:hypothetical protein
MAEEPERRTELSERVSVMESTVAVQSVELKDHENRLRDLEKIGNKVLAYAAAGGFFASLITQIFRVFAVQ